MSLSRLLSVASIARIVALILLVFYITTQFGSSFARAEAEYSVEENILETHNQSGTKKLALEVALTETGPFELGDEFPIDFTITNPSDEVALDVRLKLGSDRAIEYVDGDFLESVPLSGGTFILGDIEPGSSIDAKVIAKLIGFQGAKKGDLKLKFMVKATGVGTTSEKITVKTVTVEKTKGKVPSTGGTVNTFRDLTTFTFPEGWYEDEADVEYQLEEAYVDTSETTGTILSFEVEAKDRGVIDSFEKPVLVTLDMGTLLPNMDPSEYQERIQIITRHKESDPWEIMPFEVDEKEATIQYEASHFSESQANVTPEQWAPTFNPPGASEYTGAATYGYSFDLPPGIAGLNPSLALSYNSRGLDLLKYPVIGDGPGKGWSMAIPEITNNNYSQLDNHNYSHDKYVLQIGGRSYNLDPLGSGRYGEYAARGGLDIKIELVGDPNHGNVTGEYWIVTMPDGTDYRFGYNADAEQVVHINGNTAVHNGSQVKNDDFAAARWMVDTIEDVSNNLIEFTYTTSCGRNSDSSVKYFSGQCNETDTILNEITYNYQDENGENPQTKIELIHQTLNAPVNKRPDIWEEQKLVSRYRPQTIKIYTGSNLIKRYELDYENLYHSVFELNGLTVQMQSWLLTQVQEYGSTGSALPATTFTYGDEWRLDATCQNKSSENGECLGLLTKVDNGYGGVTEIDYSFVNHQISTDEFDKAYIVRTIDSWDGVERVYGTNNPTARTLYHRQDVEGNAFAPCFDRRDSHHSYSCALTGDVSHSESLMGYEGVVVDTQEYVEIGNSWDWVTLSRRQIKFDISNYWKAGNMLEESKFKHPSTLLSQVTQTWVQVQSSYNYQVENRTAIQTSDSISLTTTQAYTYYTGANDYGAVKTFVERDENNQVVRCTEYKYGHNTTAHLLNMPLRTTVKDSLSGSDCAGNKVAETLYRYKGSNNADDTSIGDEGQLEWLFTLRDAENNRYVSEKYTHTADGLPKRTTIFESDFIATSGTDAYPTDGKSWTELTYNSFGQPNAIKQGKHGEGATFTESITYEGNKPWLPNAVTAADSTQTKYAYDTFGRLIKVANPGDTLGDPSVETVYYDDPNRNGGKLFIQPLLINTKYKDDLIHHQRRFYDGMGRLIQEQSQQQNVYSLGTKDILTLYGYDARGLQTCAATPYSINPYSSSSQTPFEDYPCRWRTDKTTTVYDALGRKELVTYPDGTTTEYLYKVKNRTVNGNTKLLLTQVTDANNNPVNYFYDWQNQLVQVREIRNGSHYADTTYAYDLLGNLTQVVGKDLGTNTTRTTNMTYNALGQKLTMTDPDMGTWAYSYNVAGNLIRQVDNGNKVICFKYDPFNRLVKKGGDLSPSTDCPNPENYHDATSYEYGTSGTSKGKVVQVTWPGGADSFLYDGRGRMDKQVRTIENRTFEAETLSFDVLNRPLQVKFKIQGISESGDTISFDYDPQGENGVQIGAQSIVDSVGYNSRGQVAWINRSGNRADTTLTYYGSSGNHRLKEIVHGSDRSVLPKYELAAYDNVGNITSLKTIFDGSTETQSFTYDDLNRLIFASASGGPANYSHSYAYDPFGRMTDMDGVSFNYENTGNSFHGVDSIGDSQSPDLVFDYNASGNMTKRENLEGVEYTQTFDVENRLITVDPDTGAPTEFAYDPDGQRVLTTQPDGSKIYTPFVGYEVEYPASGGTQGNSQNVPAVVPKERITRSPERTNSGESKLASAVSSNLLTNGDFESGTSPWQVKGGTYSLVGGAYSGSNAARVVTNGSSNQQLYVNDMSLKPNTDYVVTFAAYANSNDDMDIQVLQDGGSWSLQADTQSVTLNSGGWQTYSVNFTTNSLPQENQDTRFRFRFNGASQTYYIDAVVLQEGSGGSPTATPTSAATATVTPTATSTLAGPTPTFTSVAPTATVTPGSGGVNLLTNGDFESGTSPWQVKGGTYSLVGSAYSGSNAARVVTNGSSNQQLYVNDLSLKPNTDYVVTFAAYANSSDDMDIQVLQDGGSWSLQADTQSVTLNSGGWQTYSVGFTTNSLPQENQDTRFRFRFNGASQTYYIDAVVLQEGSGGSPTATPTSAATATVTPTATSTLVGPTPTATATAAGPTPTSVPPTPTAVPTSSAKRIERITVSLVGRPMAVQVTAFDSVTGSTEIQEASGLYFLYTDHLGSVTAVTDVTGARIGDVTRFLPFGEYRGTEPTADHVTDQGFTGHKENREIGLTYMNARFYVPEIGQFASADTIVPDPMNPQSFNRYAYGYNNPVKYFDPDGHCPSPVNNGYEGEATSIICVAFFIPTAESEVFPPPNFIGDDRDFSSDSDISASRAWVWIDTDTGDILDQYIHPTCNTLGQCAGPLNETGLYQNSIETELDENGNIHLDYNIRCAGLRCGVAPGPNGEITFSKRDDGSFTSQGDINEFPNVEAYFYDDLQEQPTTLFRHRFVSQDDVEAGLTPFITSFSGMLGINQFSWDYRNNQRIGGH